MWFQKPLSAEHILPGVMSGSVFVASALPGVISVSCRLRKCTACYDFRFLNSKRASCLVSSGCRCQQKYELEPVTLANVFGRVSSFLIKLQRGFSSHLIITASTTLKLCATVRPSWWPPGNIEPGYACQPGGSRLRGTES